MELELRLSEYLQGSYDKSTVEGEELRGNPMLWTIKHWTTVLGPCAGNEGDLLFEKNSIGLKRGEEFS